MSNFSCFYGVFNRKIQIFESFFFYDNKNVLIDDLVYLREHYIKGSSFSIPNYVIYPIDYDLYLLGRIYPDDVGNVNHACYEYICSIDSLLERC